MLSITSIQRRQERFRIILCWKILEGLVPQQGNIKCIWRPYKGRLVLEPTIKQNSKAKLLTTQAARLFNSLPQSIRNYRTADGGTLEGFKRTLGTYIDCSPNLPRDQAGGWMPDPTDNLGRHSNSQHHWRPFLKKNHPTKLNNLDQIVLLRSYGVPGGIAQETGTSPNGQT